MTPSRIPHRTTALWCALAALLAAITLRAQAPPQASGRVRPSAHAPEGLFTHSDNCVACHNNLSTATGDEHFAPSPSPGQAIDPMLRVDDSAMDWEQESLPEELKQAGLSLQAYGSEMTAAPSDEMFGDWLPPAQHMYPEPPH